MTFVFSFFINIKSKNNCFFYNFFFLLLRPTLSLKTILVFTQITILIIWKKDFVYGIINGANGLLIYSPII